MEESRVGSVQKFPRPKKPKLIREDLIGQKFGDWEVLAVTPQVKHENWKLWSRCKCGYLADVLGGPLLAGILTKCKRCADKKHTKSPVKIGDKYGKWTVLEVGEKAKGGPKKWKCRCECGTEKHIVSNDLIRGKTLQCRDCRTVANSTGGIGTFWHQITKGAKQRDISWEVTWEELYALLQKQNFKCALTGWTLILPETSYGFINGERTASLDRIDSSKSYRIDNVQWVHKDINILKSSFQQDKFVYLCTAVAKYAVSDKVLSA